MKKIPIILITLILLASFILPALAAPANAYGGYPTFSIVSVDKNKTVTIQTYNFPANDTFTVTMGYYGTLGISGTVVESTSSGSGGSFTKAYTIPSYLAGQYLIAIRLQSPTSGYYAYNWFYNTTAGGAQITPIPNPTPAPTPVPVVYPSFSIVSVVKGKSVTILTQNFPANDSFTVTMGLYGTLGIGGTAVDTTPSGSGGAFTKTYTIPSALAGKYMISIRLQSPTTGYYAYNWFYNVTAP